MAEFEWSFDLPSETDDFGVFVAQGRVISDHGFRSGPEEGTYRWDGRTDSPTIRIRVDLRSIDSGGFGGQKYVATEDWMFAPVPHVGIVWYNDRFTGSQIAFPLADESFDRLSRDVEGTGVMGRRNVYLGPYTEHSQMGDGQRFRLIVPDTTTLSESPADVLSALTDASGYMVGTVHEEILIFALPDPIRRGGVAYSRFGEFWVHADSRLDSPENVWFHEYMHTRQTYNVSADMEWFVEASAEYHAAVLTWQQDRASAREAIQHLTREGYDREVLSEPNTWSSQYVPYYKGGSVLFALDDEIRDRTDDDRWLGHVIYEMHQHEGQVTYSDFKRIVADVVGESLDDWLDRYVTTSEPPPVNEYRSLSSQTATSTATHTQSSEGSDTNEDHDTERGAQLDSDVTSVTASEVPAGSSPGSGNNYLLNAFVGGIVGYWIWNREENRNNDRGFAIGLAVSVAFLVSLLLGVFGLVIYYYFVQTRPSDVEGTIEVDSSD